MNNAVTSAPVGRVLVATVLVDAWQLFIARALSHAGYEVTIMTYLEPVPGDLDHKDIMKYFLPNPFCRIVDLKEKPKPPEARYDFAITGMRGITSPDQKRMLLGLIGPAPLQAVVLRQYNSRLRAMANLVLKEMRQPFLRRSSLVLVEEYIKASWALRLLTKTSQLGVVPHQRVICQGLPAGLSNKSDRSFFFNFLGSHSGPRVPIANRLEAQFKITRGGEQEVSLGGKTIRMMWHSDRPNSTRNRPLNEYLDTLGNSFFTLCLPGYEVITHRALESIHCGSIPVLPAESISHYLIPLEHGRNCWAVKNNDWETAMAEVIALDRDKVFELQNAVKKLAGAEASIPSLEKRCLRMLGLNPA
jgi:hypothetical protein